MAFTESIRLMVTDADSLSYILAITPSLGARLPSPVTKCSTPEEGAFISVSFLIISPVMLIPSAAVVYAAVSVLIGL